MKQIISTTFFLLLLVVMPLIFRMHLLLEWPAMVLAVFITLLLNTQPPLNLKEAKANRSTDKNTVLLITLVCGIGLLFSAVEWAYLRDGVSLLNFFEFLALAVTLFGIILRIWAIQILKTAFSSTVQVKEHQKLIIAGPYLWFRHPSYTGAWLSLVGMAIILHSIAGILCLGIGMLLVYQKRIRAEEETLLRAFGESYNSYMQKTWRMFPGW